MTSFSKIGKSKLGLGKGPFFIGQKEIMETVSLPIVTSVATVTLEEGGRIDVGNAQVERLNGGGFRLTLTHNDGSDPQIRTFSGPFTIGQATAKGLINYQFN